MKIFNKVSKIVLAMTMTAAIVSGCASGDKVEKPNVPETPQAETGTEVDKVEKVNYPVKQLTITCPPAAGGGTDLLYRAMAPKIQEYLGVPVIVVNKPGAGCAIGYAAGAKDKPDGSSVTAAVAELLSVPIIADVDFTYETFDPIANVNSTYGALTVAADAPYNTLEEFIAYAKDHPGEITIGNSGIGSNWHILAASFADEAGIDVVHVPFDGAGPAGVALAGGHVDAVPVSPQEVDVHVKSGKAKILATFSPERLPELPDLETAKELGYGDTVLTIFRGFVAPKGTPEDVKQMLDDAFQYALNSPEITKFMDEQNFAKHYLNADDFVKLMEREVAIYENQFKDLGLTK